MLKIIRHHLRETRSAGFPTVPCNNHVLFAACLNPLVTCQTKAISRNSSSRQMEALIGHPRHSGTSSRGVANMSQKEVFVNATQHQRLLTNLHCDRRSLPPLCFIRLPLGKSYPHRPKAQGTRGYHLRFHRLPSHGLGWVALRLR